MVWDISEEIEQNRGIVNSIAEIVEHLATAETVSPGVNPLEDLQREQSLQSYRPYIIGDSDQEDIQEAQERRDFHNTLHLRDQKSDGSPIYFTIDTNTKKVPFRFLNDAIGKTITLDFKAPGDEEEEINVDRIIGTLELFKSRNYDGVITCDFYMKQEGGRKVYHFTPDKIHRLVIIKMEI